MGTEEAADAKCADSVSELETKIIRQIEYYFGDFNLQRDKFLREKIKENDGWIPMEIMVKFNRLRQLSDDYAVITDALKKSPNQLMEVNDDGTMIRRSLGKPLPDTVNLSREERDRRSIYVKGFKESTSLDELLDFFKPFKNPENVCMRRRANKKFKGSVFVTFKTEEDAAAFLELKDVKFCGTDLLRETKMNYIKRKDALREEWRKEKEEKKKRREAQTEQRAKEESVEVSEEDVKRGCLLKLVGLGESTMREDIKEILEKHGRVIYIDYSKGQPQAVVRFEMPVASEVLEKVSTEVDGERQVKIKDSDVTASLVEGEEEIDYWKSIESLRAKMRGSKRVAKKRGWTGRNGKQFRGKPRKGKRARRDDGDQSNEEGSGDEDEPNAKAAKVQQDEPASD